MPTILIVLSAAMLVALPTGFVESLDVAVVAKVGPREISRAMLDDAVTQALNTGYFHRRMTDDRRRELEQEQIGRLILRELNYLGAVERQVVLPEGQAEAARAKIEGSMGRKTYEASLGTVGMTRKDHVKALSETMLAAEAYRRFVLEPAAVGDDEIRAAFDANPDHWTMPESLHLLHILLKVPPGANDVVVEEVRDRAGALVERILGGEDFSDVAAGVSEDMYRIKGGDLGWVHRGRLLPVIDEAAWGAEAGDLIGPLRSAEGFHITKVLGRRPARPMDFSEVEPMLREQLEKEKLARARAEWFEPLRKKFPVVILVPALSEGID